MCLSRKFGDKCLSLKFGDELSLLEFVLSLHGMNVLAVGFHGDKCVQAVSLEMSV